MAYRHKAVDERIAEAEEAVKQAKARLQREKARVREAERKADTRRKIIAGALALEHKDPAFRAQMDKLIQEYVTKPQDRALFGLPPLPEPVDG